MAIDIRKHMNLLVGFFVFSALVIGLVGFILILSSQGIFNPVYKLYTVFPDGVGLRKGTAVLFNGVKVGSVDNIHLVSGNGNGIQFGSVVLDLSIDARYQSFITDSSYAYVMRDKNLVSDRVINIKSDNASSHILKHRDTVRVGTNQDIETVLISLDNLMDKVDNLIGEAEDIIAKVQNPKTTIGAILGSRELYDTVMVNLDLVSKALNMGTGVLYDAKKLEGQVAGHLPGILNNADTTFGVLVGASFKLDRVVSQLNAVAQDITEILSKTDKVIDDGSQELENAGQLIDAVSDFWFVRGKIDNQKEKPFNMLLNNLGP